MTMNVAKSISRWSSNRTLSKLWYSFVITVFFLFILIPTTYVLLYIVLRFNEINAVVLGNGERMRIIINAITLSFAVSFAVTFIDILFGLPLAWLIARKNFYGKELVNTLIESPLSIPTAGLGFSAAIFWGHTPGIKAPFGALQIFTDVFVLIVLFHFTTTFPYVVRSLTEILEELDQSYEIAALTCGASRFTAARTITLPMFRSGLATASVLAFAKSLSDTGGVVTLLRTLKGANLTENDRIQGTALVDVWKGVTKNPDISPAVKAQYEAALAFVSFLLIVLALIIIFAMKTLIKKSRSPVKKVAPNLEHKISKGLFVRFRDTMAITYITLFVFVPSFFLVNYLFTNPLPSNVEWGPFIQSIFTSFFVAGLATVLNVIVGVPVAIYITRKSGIMTRIIDSLIDVPYLVPSAAVGISVRLFWKTSITGWLPEILLVVFAHMAMTFPFIARNVVGGLEEFDVAIEEAAQTLGARPFDVFLEVVLPSIKGSIVAGAIMGFTRSVGETGATLAVSDIETAPVYIVNQVKSGQYVLAGASTLVLTAISYIILWSLKILINSEQIRKDLNNIFQRLKIRKSL